MAFRIYILNIAILCMVAVSSVDKRKTITASHKVTSSTTTKNGIKRGGRSSYTRETTTNGAPVHHSSIFHTTQVETNERIIVEPLSATPSLERPNSSGSVNGKKNTDEAPDVAAMTSQLGLPFSDAAINKVRRRVINNRRTADKTQTTTTTNEPSLIIKSESTSIDNVLKSSPGTSSEGKVSEADPTTAVHPTEKRFIKNTNSKEETVNNTKSPSEYLLVTHLTEKQNEKDFHLNHTKNYQDITMPDTPYRLNGSQNSEAMVTTTGYSYMSNSSTRSPTSTTETTTPSMHYRRLIYPHYECLPAINTSDVILQINEIKSKGIFSCSSSSIILKHSYREKNSLATSNCPQQNNMTDTHTTTGYIRDNKNEITYTKNKYCKAIPNKPTSTEGLSLLNDFIDILNSSDECLQDGDCYKYVVDSVCSCDDTCKLFNDCCWQIKQSLNGKYVKEMKDKKEYYSCKPFYPSPLKFYSVARCKENVVISEALKRKCEHISYDNPEEVIPVVSKTNVVYRNLFCALCHDVFDFSPFMLKVGDACISLLNPQMQSFTEAWKTAIKNPQCNMSYGFHHSFSGSRLVDERLCGFETTPEAFISNEEEWIKSQLCNAYLNPVMYDGKMYRNSFCLPKMPGEYKCMNFRTEMQNIVEYAQPKSLRNLINFMPINNVEKACGENEILNKEEKSCERLSCPKGFYPYYEECRWLDSVNAARVTSLFFTTYKGQLHKELVEYMKNEVDQSLKTLINFLSIYNISVWVESSEIRFKDCYYFITPIYFKLLGFKRVSIISNLMHFFIVQVLLPFITHELESSSSPVHLTQMNPYSTHCYIDDKSIEPRKNMFVHFNLSLDANFEMLAPNSSQIFKTREDPSQCKNWGKLTTIFSSFVEIVNSILNIDVNNTDSTCIENNTARKSEQILSNKVITMIVAAGVMLFMLLLIAVSYKLYRMR